ncbi:MAG: hypothetical protein ABI999_07280 [Acidobacteriota bacterium]
MRTIKTNGNELMAIRSFSRRIENAVEIIERETVKTVAIESPAPTGWTQMPRLVIEDAVEATRDLIAKARSEASGSAVLRELIGTRVQTR